MKDLIKSMLAIGATIGLSDKEAFVAKVSGIITTYQQDPAQADKWAATIAQLLENYKNDYRIQQVVESAMAGSHMPDRKNIADLTEAIQQLTQLLQEKKGETNV